MNDVGGCDSGTGLRAGKSSRSSADANFEPYDDSEWDVGIGNLIIDLDADIEKNTEQQSTDTNRLITSPASSTSSSSSPTPNQMHIPTNAAAPPSSTSVGNSSSTTGGSTSTNSSGGKANSSKSSSSSSSSSSGSSTKHAGSADMEHSAVVDKGLKMKIKRKPGTKSGSEVKHEIVKNDSLLAASNLTNSSKNSSSDSSSSGKSAHHHSSSSSSKNNLINSENDSHGVVNNNGVTSKESNKESLNSNNDSGGGGGGGGSKKTSNRKGSKDTKDGGNGRGEGNKKVKNSGGSGGGGSTKSIKGDTNTSNNSSDVTNSNKSHHGKESLSSTTATVSLNVPTIVPGGSSSSAFGKVNSSTLKVPQSNSTTSGSSNLSLQQHSSSSDSSSGRTCSGSGNNNNSGNTSSHLSSWNSSSTSSPSSKGDGTSKNLVDKVQNNTNNTSGVSLSSYSNKKGKNSFSNSSEKLGGEIDGLNSSGGGHFNSSNSSRSASALTTSSPNVTDLSVGGGTSVNHHQGISMSHHHQHQSLNAKGRPSTQDVCVGTSVGTVTEPDCLGPCEPGTSVTLEGIVWHETESGVLVVNVTWRGKTYVGTLLDCTKSEWAPPRFCDSPTSDLEMRLPKNRGKRGGRGQQSTPVNELTSAADAAAALLQQGLGSGGSLGLSGAGNGGNGRPGQNPKLRNGAKGRRGSAAAGTSAAAAAASFITPASPMKGQNSNSDNSLPKRKTRGSETESANDDLPVSSKNAKRPKMLKDKTPGSPSSVLDGDSKSGPSSPALIECPEPNCSKKYKHINGLRYHQSHAHCVVAEDSDSNASTTSNAKEAVTPTIDTPGGSADSNNSAVVIDGELESMDTTNGSSETAGSGETAMDVDKSEEPLVKNLSSKNSGGSSSKKEVESVGDSKEVSPGVSRAPILTVPVPYISLQGRNAMSGGDVLKVVGSTPKGNASGGVPWQPHHHGVQGQVGGGGSGGGMVSLNIPMSGESKSKDKNGGEGKSGKTKHKKSKKEKEKKQQGQDSGSPSKSEQCGGSGGGRGGSTPGGLFGSSSSVQRDSVSSEDNEVRMVVGGGSAGDASGGRLGVLEDPQSPAYSDISDANDSGDAVELTTVGKDLKSPPDLLQQKKDLHVPLHGIVPQPPATQHQPPPQLSHPQQQGLHGPPPPGMSPFYPAFYNPYTNLEPPNSKLGGDKGDEGMMDKGMKVPPGQQPGMKGPPPPQQQPPPGQPPSSGDVDGSRGRSPKLDFHPKYLSQQHFFHYPYSNYHFDGSHGQYGGMMGGGGGGNGGPPDGPGNAFNPHGRGGPGVPAFGLMEHEKEKEHLEKEKDGGIPLGMNIKQEPGEKMHHKDTGRHSSHLKSSEMMEKDRMGLLSDIKTEYGMSPSDFSSGGKSGGGHFGPIGCSKHGGNSSSGKDSSGKREESKGSSDSNKKESEEKDRKESEGKGPTMETTGPPPPPTAGTGFAYLPQPYNPFGLHFDPGHPLYRQVIVPGPFGGPPYMHPHAGGIPRFQPPPPPPSGPPGSGGGPPGGMPEDLSRASVGGANPGGPPPGGPTAKALDMLQHHAQYYQVHKIHELSERALKSPSPQVVQQRERPDRSDAPTAPPQPPSQPQSSSSSVNPTAASPGGGSSSSSRNLVKGGPADLSNKDPNSSKMNIGCVNESSRSPPTQHHVHSHTHHHTHVGIGYPIIPAFSAPHSPHFGVIPTAPPTAASVIPPFPTPKPN